MLNSNILFRKHFKAEIFKLILVICACCLPSILIVDPVYPFPKDLCPRVSVNCNPLSENFGTRMVYAHTLD